MLGKWKGEAEEEVRWGTGRGIEHLNQVEEGRKEER
jgi:hypothetical protein